MSNKAWGVWVFGRDNTPSDPAKPEVCDICGEPALYRGNGRLACKFHRRVLVQANAAEERRLDEEHRKHLKVNG